jgi:hypothetical protein
VAATGGHSGPKVYATGSYPDNVCAGITSGFLHLGTTPALTFWSKYNLETDWDKGEVQVSTNGGTTWVRVPVNYPGYVSNTSDGCNLPAGNYFNGDNNSYAQYSGSLATWEPGHQDPLGVLRHAVATSAGSRRHRHHQRRGASSYEGGLALVFADSFESGDTGLVGDDAVAHPTSQRPADQGGLCAQPSGCIGLIELERRLEADAAGHSGAVASK